MECALQAPGIQGDLTMFNRQHKSDLQEIQRFSCALTEANAKLAAIPWNDLCSVFQAADGDGYYNDNVAEWLYENGVKL